MKNVSRAIRARDGAFTASQQNLSHRSPLLKVIGAGLAYVALTTGVGAATQGQPKQASGVGCDERFAEAIQQEKGVKVLLVKSFLRGHALQLDGASTSAVAAVEGAGGATPPVAGVDLCLVKLMVGPGNPGPADAASTSAGIGIELLLPNAKAWNERIRVYGNSGWSGTPQGNPALIASDDIHAAAAAQGFVVATSDNGHVGSPVDASFALNPDGSSNKVGWQDFSERSLHELAVKTKAVSKLYYGRAHTYAYWDGFSTGGRQGLKLAQKFPDDFDGILVGSPAINWTRYHTAGLYGQIAMKQDLGRMISKEKLDTATQASIKACGGQGLGFVMDPLACRYDPSLDADSLCKGERSSAGAIGKSASEGCLTVREADVINKAWFGQTMDGSAPRPAMANGGRTDLSDHKRLWYGWTRGTDLKTTPVGGAPGLILAADQTALEMRDPSLGSEMLKNATGNGNNRWAEILNYESLANSQVEGVRRQTEFADINTDRSDLGQFKASGGKMILYQGLADEYIPPQGAIDYYEKTQATMGGAESVTSFFRFYLIPGFTHSGRSEGPAGVPTPQPASGRDEMFAALQTWVEGKQAPGSIVVQSSDQKTSMPLCVYPSKAIINTGSVRSASSYACN